jgi:hypothetical protein
MIRHQEASACVFRQSEAKWRDLRLTHPASNTNERAALPLSSRGHGPFGPPKVMKNTLGLATALQ